jgi:hypothetical protein
MLHFYWAFLFIASWQQGSQQNVGTKLVWHFTSGTFAGGEVTTYTMGDRRRTEYRNTAQHRNASGSFEPGDPSPNVVIQRCDLERTLELDTSRAEYISKEYPPKPLTPEERKARGFDDPDWDTSTLPAFRVETTTVDTGEREEILGQWARHVTTTIKSTPLGDTNAEPSVTITDGWYLDYDRRISCEPKPSKEPKVHDFSWIVINGRYRILTQKIVNIEVGHRETGLLVKKGQNSATMTLTGSNGVHASSDIEITEFFEGPLDPVLFETPSGFKRVDTLHLSPAK